MIRINFRSKLGADRYCRAKRGLFKVKPRWRQTRTIRRPAVAVAALFALLDRQQLVEPRPHRREQTPDEAASHLRAEVKAGRLDGDAVEAVLRAAGHPVRQRRAWPAGLTSREVEVLRLAARGLSNQEIAERLVISRKTAANHVEHIYSKIGVSNRARASLFAVQHGLITDPQPGDDI